MFYTKHTGFLSFFLQKLLVCVTVILSSLSLTFSKFPTDHLIYTSAYKLEKPTIIIDAGHGGEDCGAIGIIDGVYEKDLNMQISMKLGDYICAAGYPVIYTRTDDCLLYKEEENIKGFKKIYDLKNRVAIANSYSNAIFISIHMNSFGSEECSGLQVYYSPNDILSKFLAESVQSSVVYTLQPMNKRRIKEGDDIYVLENISIPAILIECGFISNTDECKKLSEKEYQKELCFSILCGIIDYASNKTSNIT